MEEQPKSPSIQTRSNYSTLGPRTPINPDSVNNWKIPCGKSSLNKEIPNRPPSRKISRINWVSKTEELSYAPKKKIIALPPTVEKLLLVEYENRCHLTRPIRYLTQLMQEFSFSLEWLETGDSFYVRNICSQLNDLMTRTARLGFAANSVSTYRKTNTEHLYALNLRFSYPD